MIDRAGLAQRLRQERAIAVWSRVAGPDLAARSRALEVRDGTLWVGVENAAWAAQMSFLRSELLERLRAEGAAVAAIQFRLARLARGSDPAAPAAPRPTLPPPATREVRLADRLAAPLEDQQLAGLWRSLVLTGLRRSRGRADAGALDGAPSHEEG